MSTTQSFTAEDVQAMHEALAWADKAIGLSDPNPRVGCVLVGAGWRAGGHTQAAGEAHAEVMALRAARQAGHDPRGSTAYVTLEPCAHHGRTPPCCDALIDAGVARVVVALEDPFPQVAGKGLARLRQAGIDVRLGLLAAQARDINIGFLSRVQRGRPWVRMKIAASLDGRTALHNGESQWITGPEARADGHAWRKRAGAVLTGIGTVRDDDPRLDVRLVGTHRQPLRVIVDSRLEITPTARVLQPPGQALVYTTVAASRRHLDAIHAEVAPLPSTPDGKTDLAALLDDLATRGINELHVEAGHRLNGSLLRAGLVDELLVYLAPTLLGSGRDMAAFGPLERLADGLPFHFVDSAFVGTDLRLRLRRAGAAEF
ncbi:bifunctional diaminohydroxyphosphoribosylaminopyrimidine deaminase/5-amino-6-(5-phosphoribosylamino)uracil reductase RibD [Aquincola sp. MAHUQ-54]|uniref:Riboflavin biosynthesis protein RibD n=1 Tax=Aquincola agrisoli TaxID=3119538 RepID=A0AAW9QCV0_9BURK